MNRIWSPARLLAVLACFPVASSVYAVEVNVEAENYVHTLQSAAGGAITYSLPVAGDPPVVVVRTEQPLLCAASGAASGQHNVVVDPNGYTPSYSIGGLRSTEDPSVSYSSSSLFRAAERLQFDSGAYGESGVPGVVSFDLTGVAASCSLGLATVDPGPQVSPCVSISNAESNSIFRSGMDPVSEGTLALSSRIVVATDTVVYYEHQLTAMGGPVYGIRFREMFPYYLVSTAAPRFVDSMRIDSEWRCEASEGASCGFTGRTLVEQGYAHLNGASLAHGGACLKVWSMRPLRSDGFVNNDFSGAIHAMSLSTPLDPQDPPQVSQTRLQFDN